ncbi:MAG: glucosaminidase domain-containing protein [Phaeodactylibacter sp.]|nr:glucosaminidase domain-containing protein [Phaeodactylibacter sp.]MCB9273067.1 glucosaminidase domain-containing protein [Lewinellaceae bacterium]
MANYVSRVVTSLLFFLALLAGLYFYQHNKTDWESLPIVTGLTDAYARGLDRIYGLSNEAIQDFYNQPFAEQTEQQQIDSWSSKDEGKLAVRTSWKRDSILLHLRAKGFSRDKLRQTAPVLDYIGRYKTAALNEMYRSRVPASIKLAQGILESSSGHSKLARASRNHFGIKARPQQSARDKIARRQYAAIRDDEFTFTAPAVDVFKKWDDHSYDRFEVYRSVGDSYARHSQLLTRPCSPGQTGCYAWIWQAYPVSRQEWDISEAAGAFYHRSGIAAGDFFGGRTHLPYYAACAAGLKMAGYATSPHYHQKIAYIIETYELWRFDFDLIRAVEERDTGG